MNTSRTSLFLFKTGILIAGLLTATSVFSATVTGKEIRFTVTHPFKTVHGNCETIQIQGLNATIRGDALHVNGPFKISVPINDMTTQNSNRDSNMYRILGYPEVKEIVGMFQSVVSTDGTHYTVTGNLKIKNKTLPLKTEAVFKKEGEHYTFVGEFTVSLTQYDVERPELLVPVDDPVLVNFKFQFAP